MLEKVRSGFIKWIFKTTEMLFSRNDLEERGKEIEERGRMGMREEIC